jgi:hypothetical protein
MQLIIDLNNRPDLIEAKGLIEDRLVALADETPLAELADEAVARLGDKGRSTLARMLGYYGADNRFTLKEAAQHLQTPYPELRNVMYRSVGRVLAEPLLRKQWTGSQNEYWFDAPARVALVAALG